MKIEIEVSNINYEEFVELLLPELKKVSDNTVLQTVSSVPPHLVRPIIRTFPKHTLDKLTANLINQKKDLVIQKLQDTAIQKGVHIKIDNICVENRTE